MIDKKDELNSCLSAYGNNYYEKELRFQSEYFPKRVIELEGGEDHIQNQSVLDLGIGTGYSVCHFSNIVRNYTVLEGGNSIINNFKAKHPDISANIIETYFEDYVPEEKLDIIVMGCILEHVDHPLELLCYYKRFLKDSGRMYLAVPNWEALHKKIAFYAGMIPDMHFLSERDYELGHKRTFAMDSFQKLIKDAGLHCLKMEGIFLKPVATSQMEQLMFDDSIYSALINVGKDYPELSAMLFAQVSIS